MSGRAPLADVRVADFGHFIAAPLCASLLADMGADVVRIERPGGSEDRAVTSLFARPDGRPGEGPSFLQHNRNKRGLAVDITSPEGAVVIRRLIEWADIVVVNFPQQVLEKLGLDFASVHALNDRAILVTTTAFGASGPYADRVGFDPIAQAMAGVTWFSGTVDGPQRTQATWVDFATGMMGAFGALAALRAREESGLGQAVTTSLFGTALSIFNAYLMEQAVTAPGRIPHGNRAHTAGPADVFRCRDGFIFTAVQTNGIFKRWARAVGALELLDDARFVDDVSRGNHGAALSDRMQAWCTSLTVAEAIAALEAERVPAGPVYNLDEVLSDPHVVATGAFVPVEFPGIDRAAPIARTPVSLSDYEPKAMRRAPLAGEDNESVLEELGFDAPVLADWRLRGII